MFYRSVIWAIYVSMQFATVGAVWFNSSNSMDGKDIFECHKNISLHCQSDVKPYNFNLRINGNQAVACGSSCFVFSSNLGRYTVDHNATLGIINLYLTSVTELDEQTNFTCLDNLGDKLIQPKIIVFPKNDTAHMTNVSDASGSITNITIKTGCTRKMGSVDFVWKKTKNKDGTGLEELKQGEYEDTLTTMDNTYCDPSKNCGGYGLSKTIKLNTGGSESYYIHCTILTKDPMLPGQITRISDTPFSIRDESSTTDTTSISTISTATSSSSLPSSSIEIITTSSSTGTSSAIPGKQQKQNDDKTSTILIIAFSSIAGIALILLVVFSLNKIRKRNSKQSGASTTHELKPDPNNQ